MSRKINKYFPYILIYMCYYTNLPIKLEEIIMLIFIGWIVIEKKFWNLKLDLKIVGVISYLGLISLIQSYYHNFPVNRVIEQIIIIGTMFIGYNLMFKKYGYKKLFKIYLKISFFVCVLGLLQFVIFLLIKKDILMYPIGCNIRKLPLIAGKIPRIRSIAYEPGWFAQTLIPAVIYNIEYIFKVKKFKYKNILVILVFFMTMSSGALIILPLYFIFFRLKTIKQGIISLIIMSLGIIVTKNIWIDKVYETLFNLKKLSVGVFYNINASSFAILSNLYVALNNNSLLLGVGLGNHPYSYFRNFINKKIGVYHFYGLNSMDAYSLFSRMISEIGLIFTLYFIYFLFKNLNKKYTLKSKINIGAFLAIISFFIRGGLYTRFGTAFIIMLFYYTRKKRKKSARHNFNKLSKYNG